MPARHRRLLSLALLLVSTLLALLAAEWGVRLLAPQALVVPWQDEIDGITAPRPGVAGRHVVPGVFDVRIRYSAQRFRGGREYAERVPDGVLRLAALGDSFTFGYGAEDHEAYPAQLERQLSARLSGREGIRQAEVINAGNGGTGTGEQALWFDIQVRRFRPALVVLAVTSNDLDDDLRRGLFHLRPDGSVAPPSYRQTARADSTLRKVRKLANALPGYDYLSQRAHLLALMRNLVSSHLAADRAARMTVSIPTNNPGPKVAGNWIRATRTLEGEVAWLNRQVKDMGARLLVVFIPSRESVYAEESPFNAAVEHRSGLIRRTLARVCEAEEIPCRDLTDLIRSKAKVSTAPLYYSGLDTHPTPNGYAVIAAGVTELVFSQLSSSGCLANRCQEQNRRVTATTEDETRGVPDGV